MKRSIRLVALVLAAQLAVVTELTAPANAAFPGNNGLIAFFGSASGNDDIWVVAPDGTGLRQLTTDPGDDQFPSWSSDGRHLAYSGVGRGGDRDIYVVAPDGSARRQVTAGHGDDITPAWSPDGTSIAF